MTIRLACSALLNRAYAGHPNKAGDGFRGERHDVTSDVYKIIAEMVGIDREVTVCVNGQPKYVVMVLSLEKAEEIRGRQ